MTQAQQPSHFTEEDVFNPVYCPRCHRHVPRAEAERYRRLCQDCATELYYTDTEHGKCPRCGSTNIAYSQRCVTCNYCGQYTCSAFEHDLNSSLAQLRGTRLHNRYEWVEYVRPILFAIDQHMRVEAQVTILLSDVNEVLDSIITLGGQFHVQFSLTEILAAARRLGARKLIMAHSHPNEYWATPSDTDVESGVRVYLYASSEGLEVVDDLVVCKVRGSPELKSVHNTHRFKQMIRQY